MILLFDIDDNFNVKLQDNTIQLSVVFRTSTQGMLEKTDLKRVARALCRFISLFGITDYEYQTQEMPKSSVEMPDQASIEGLTLARWLYAYDYMDNCMMGRIDVLLKKV